MRRDPGYRAAWAAEAGPVRFEAAPFLLSIQTVADLAAAEWGLAVWDDPDVEAWRTPFLPGVPVLVAEPDPDPWPDPTPLLGLLGEAGARLEGLRLLNGRFVLKAELGDAALQILVPSGRAFGPGDGIVAKLGLSLPLEAPVGRIVDLCGGSPPAPSSDAALRGRADRALVSVLDGIGAEKSHRWMAERIWGEARVAEEWSSESWMPAQVRRWIPKARALAAGGWRNLVPAMCRSHGGPRRPWCRTRSGRPARP